MSRSQPIGCTHSWCGNNPVLYDMLPILEQLIRLIAVFSMLGRRVLDSQSADCVLFSFFFCHVKRLDEYMSLLMLTAGLSG